MNNNQLVSIIVPSYNYAHLIRRCIDSVISQTYPNWELIITDDHSQDNSLEVLKEYEANIRIHISSNERNLGLYGNVVKGISYAKGDYIKILMADDWLAPNYLSETLNAFQKYPAIGLCSVRTNLINTENVVLETRTEPVENVEYYPSKKMLNWTLRHINPIGNPSRVIMRRSAYEQVGGFDLDIEYCTDYELWLRILENWDCAVLPKILSYEYMHPVNATKSYVANAAHITTAEQMFLKLFKHHAFYRNHRMRQQQVWLFGLQYYWTTSLRHLVDGQLIEIKELIRILYKNSNIFFWLPLLIWRGLYIISHKSLVCLSYRLRRLLNVRVHE